MESQIQDTMLKSVMESKIFGETHRSKSITKSITKLIIKIKNRKKKPETNFNRMEQKPES